ncbi:hypothetical protein OLZ31_25380 [Enterobacter asburiae]|nr:hypothetical protein [Enterobacter asburiae]
MDFHDDWLQFKNKTSSPELTLRYFSVQINSSGNSRWNIIRQLMHATASDATSADRVEPLTAEPEDAHDMFSVSGVRPVVKSTSNEISRIMRTSLLQGVDEMLKKNLQNAARPEANASGAFNHPTSAAERDVTDAICSSVAEHSSKEPEKNIPLTTPAERSAGCR